MGDARVIEPGYAFRSDLMTWPELAAMFAGAIVLITHPLSLVNLLVDVRPSLVMASSMAFLALWLGPRLLGELTRPAKLPFALLIAWQVASLIGHVMPGAYLAHWTSPSLIANALSYIIIPQFVCFILGSALGRDEKASRRFLDTLLWSNLVAVAVAIVLHVTRPQFFLDADARVFKDIIDSYSGFIPRMNGYFNSMILGAICYSGIGLVAGARGSRTNAVVFVTVFTIGALLTLQRGAWVLAAVSFLFWGFVSLGRSLVRIDGRSRPLRVALMLAATLTVVAVVWQYAQQQAWFGVAIAEFENRVRFFDTLVDERRGQWQVALELLVDHPLGVGVGLLSHKAAEVDGLMPYAVTDGNYFRIVAETGILGIMLFLAVTGHALARVIFARRWEIAVPLLLLMAGALGTNVFDLYYIGFVFWLLLGMASSATPPTRPSGPPG